jgi:hypothetical protein
MDPCAASQVRMRVQAVRMTPAAAPSQAGVEKRGPQ